MNIAVLCLPGIGDALMATPMVRVLKRAIPAAQIDVICMFAGVAYVFNHNPHIRTVHRLRLYHQSLLTGLSEVLPIRKNAYDCSILAFPSYRREYHLVHTFIGAKKRIAHRFDHGYLPECHFLNTDLIAVDETVHNALNNLNLLSALGIKENVRQTGMVYDCILDKKDEAYGKTFFSRLQWNPRDTIGVHPGSIDSKAGMYKRWPVKRFGTLIRYLINKKKKNVLVFLGSFEADLGERIALEVSDTQHCRILDGCTLGEAIGILSKVRLFISNDNGFAHLANALRVPSIVLFGPTNPAWCAPIDTRLAQCIRTTRFAPWFRNDMKVTNPPKDARSGMEEITLSEVIEKIEKI